jgi:hypothetical protein
MRLLIVPIAHENHGAGVVGCWGRKAYAGYFLWQQCHPRESRRRSRKPHVGYFFVEHGGAWLASLEIRAALCALGHNLPACSYQIRTEMRLLVVLITHDNRGVGVFGCWGRKAYGTPAIFCGNNAAHEDLDARVGNPTSAIFCGAPGTGPSQSNDITNSHRCGTWQDWDYQGLGLCLVFHPAPVL